MWRTRNLPRFISDPQENYKPKRTNFGQYFNKYLSHSIFGLNPNDLKTLLDKHQLNITLQRLAHQLVENHLEFSESAIIGLQPRGIWFSDRIVKIVKQITGETYNVVEMAYALCEILQKKFSEWYEWAIRKYLMHGQSGSLKIRISRAMKCLPLPN